MLRTIGVPVESWNPAGLFNVLRSVGALQRAVERHAPDAIHAVGWTAAAVALGVLTPAQSARTVVTCSIRFATARSPSSSPKSGCRSCCTAPAIATCAYRTLATALTVRFGIAPERVEVIPPAVTPQLPVGITRPRGRDGPIAGYAARIDADDAWESAVDALAALAKTHAGAQLWFASQGAPHGAVHAFARARGVHDRLRFFDHPPPAELFGGVDLVVVPQGRDGLPYALPQALVDGVPVVATNHDGLADTLRPFDTGRLVPDGAGGLVAGIEAAWAAIDAAWAGAQAQRAAATAAFDPAAAAARMLAAYARVAGLPVDEETRRPRPMPKTLGSITA